MTIYSAKPMMLFHGSARCSNRKDDFLGLVIMVFNVSKLVFYSYISLRFHGREEQNFLNGVVIG